MPDADAAIRWAWSIYRLRGTPAAYVGRVYAGDAKAIAKAAAHEKNPELCSSLTLP
jgi:hypothetical protein